MVVAGKEQTMIRANQGHSIMVDVELEEVLLPEELWHVRKMYGIYQHQGLIPKGRLYAYLLKDRDTAVKVGRRHGKPVLYIVKSSEMSRDGFPFYLSKNEGWLTKEVLVKYLEKIG